MEVLSKDQKIDLTGSNPGLSVVRFGLGWDPKQAGAKVDLDVSVLALENGKDGGGDTSIGKVIGGSSNPSLLYFGRMTLPGLQHSGDNRDGAGAGDDETITAKLNELPGSCTSCVVVINAYSGAANFGSVKNANCNIYLGDSTTPAYTYDLSEDYTRFGALIVGEMYRHNGEWKFETIGKGITGNNLGDIVKRWE